MLRLITGKIIAQKRVSSYLVVLLVTGLLFAGYGYYAQYGHLDLNYLAGDFYTSHFPQLLGMVFTALLLDSLIRQREQREVEKQEREELVMRMGDGDRWAAKLLRQRGWLQNGALRRARLDNACLNGLDFAVPTSERLTCAMRC